jgi:hypothetical protein
MTENYHVPGSRCLNCSKIVDAAGPVSDGRAPQPGDISLCFYCHHVQAYGEDMNLRPLTDEEIVEIAGMPELVHAMTGLGQFKQWERDKNAQASPDNRGARRARKSSARRN